MSKKEKEKKKNAGDVELGTDVNEKKGKIRPNYL